MPPSRATARVQADQTARSRPIARYFSRRSQVARAVNLVQWDTFEEGGHFAALERPDDLVGSIRAFAKRLD